MKYLKSDEKYRGISLRLWSRQRFFNQVKKAFTLNTYVNVAFHPCSRDHAGGGIVAKSCLTLEALWTVARQAPLSMG